MEPIAQGPVKVAQWHCCSCWCLLLRSQQGASEIRKVKNADPNKRTSLIIIGLTTSPWQRSRDALAVPEAGAGVRCRRCSSRGRCEKALRYRQDPRRLAGWKRQIEGRVTTEVLGTRSQPLQLQCSLLVVLEAAWISSRRLRKLSPMPACCQRPCRETRRRAMSAATSPAPRGACRQSNSDCEILDLICLPYAMPNFYIDNKMCKVLLHAAFHPRFIYY